jgi:outer membrane protein OmpA-like peptidoglycan-associated protein
MDVSTGKLANRLLKIMKNVVFPLLVLVLLSACATSTDKEYIRCLQGFNDPSTGSGIPVGKAASVMAAGTVGAAAALVLCEEPAITESPDLLVVSVKGSLSQPLEVREPLLVFDAPAAAAQPVLFTFDSRTLQFEFDRAELMPGSEAALLSVVDYLRELPEVIVTIAGHTCWLGTEAHNQKLAEQRAQAVANFIVSQGVDADRLVVEAFGEAQPVATNQTDEGRKRNRRVEVLKR